MEKLKMFKFCFSGTVVTIWEVYFLILNPHKDLTESFISLVSHSNSTFMGEQKMKIILVKLLMFLGIKPLNSVIYKLIELVSF